MNKVIEQARKRYDEGFEELGGSVPSLIVEVKRLETALDAERKAREEAELALKLFLKACRCVDIHHHGFGPAFNAAIKCVGDGSTPDRASGVSGNAGLLAEGGLDHAGLPCGREGVEASTSLLQRAESAEAQVKVLREALERIDYPAMPDFIRNIARAALAATEGKRGEE